MRLSEEERQSIGRLGIGPLKDMFLTSVIEHPGDCPVCHERYRVVGWDKLTQNFRVQCRCSEISPRTLCHRCGQPYGLPGSNSSHGPGFCIDRRGE